MAQMTGAWSKPADGHDPFPLSSPANSRISKLPGCLLDLPVDPRRRWGIGGSWHKGDLGRGGLVTEDEAGPFCVPQTLCRKHQR